MLFNTLEFWLFFVAVLALVCVLPHKGQNRVLLVASYVFYGAWDWRFLGLLAGSTVVDYFVAPLAAPGRSLTTRRAALTTSMVVNLGVLGLFKYHDFFVQSLADLLGWSGGAADAWMLHVILPVGISFYTFQTMSYTIDVYRGQLQPVKSLLDFALYVSYFPQLVAGPIERGERLVPQIIADRKIDYTKWESALHLIAWGLFKKAVIADTIAAPVNYVFGQPSPGGLDVYLAVIGFAVQIYCDFSGYTDIARGLARMMGIDLMLNFNLPYFAQSPPDFWRRWHISLSTWLRDYLYIPLGGNRGGPWLTYRNLMITMVLGGLWHGARYNFVLWGVYHGGLLAGHRLLAQARGGGALPSAPGAAVWKTLGMFHLTLVGWLLFRVETIEQLGRLVAAMATPWGVAESTVVLAGYLATYATPLVLMQLWQWRSGELEVINTVAWPLRYLFFALCIAAVLMLNRTDASPFIYFQF